MRLVLLDLLSFVTIGLSAETNFFPIMAWNGAPSDPAVLKKLRDCGLTVAGFVAPRDLDAVHAAGLKAIVSDARVSDYDWANVDEAAVRKRVTSLVAEVGKHPAVFGYYLRDEPSASHFPGLGKISSLIHELDPGKWAYINLFPNYANSEQLGTASYTEHLDKFIATCHPTILSYDHYALMEDGGFRQAYWLNLEQMRAAAQKNRIPFWNIVLSVGCLSYREVSAADFRFQAYTTLAYGGRGISYFTYFTPVVGNFRMAPIDQFGNETATWQSMRTENLQVLQLAPTLLRLNSDDVYHFGTVPEGSHGPTEKSLVKAVGTAEFVCGDFTHEDGSRYVMVVNKDFKKSRHCSLQYQTPPKRVLMVSPYSGQLTSFEGEQAWLAPGQGVLLKIEK
ncbi:MAG: hypothetical protein HY298_23790 [Verrucomicrobia bacterium]|nr:hypothetical protein [Verrucomicrobiota bacterium]